GPQRLDWGVDRVLLRGWFEAPGLSRPHREVVVADDVWERGGRTLAIIWVASKRSDFDPDFAGRFMGKAEQIRRDLAVRLPDVTLHFTGGIASYNAYATSVRSDFQAANLGAFLGIFVLL